MREPLPEETKGYQWPADNLTVQDMANLAELRESPSTNFSTRQCPLSMSQ